MYRFIVLLGITSLFADWLYESVRAVVPQYLAHLGASALFVGFVFGLGDALAYLARLATGPLADKRGGYWLETFLGYSLQVGAVMGLLFARDLWHVAILIFLERFSKALRTPARDVLIASAGGKSAGKAYGVHAALDQIGAVAGVSMATLMLYFNYTPLDVFTAALVPGVFSLVVLYIAYSTGGVSPVKSVSRMRLVIPFGVSQFFLGVSLVHISLFMFKLAEIPWVASLLYLVAMVTEIPMSFVLGHFFDRERRVVLIGPPLALALALSFISGAFFVAGFIYATLTAYADVVAKAQAARFGGATSLGFVNAMWGVGLLVGGVLYGYLVDVGVENLILAISAASSALSLALIWRVTY